MTSPSLTLADQGDGHVLGGNGFQDRDDPAPYRVEAAVAWLVLIVAGLFEVVWAFAMKQSDGLTRPWPTAIMVGAMLLSVALLASSMRSLPLGTAYAVWTGIGAVGAFVVGIVVLGEAASPLRVVAAMLIVGGLVLMKLASPD